MEISKGELTGIYCNKCKSQDSLKEIKMSKFPLVYSRHCSCFSLYSTFDLLLKRSDFDLFWQAYGDMFFGVEKTTVLTHMNIGCTANRMKSPLLNFHRQYLEPQGMFKVTEQQFPSIRNSKTDRH
jgi:hypothetical protein